MGMRTIIIMDTTFEIIVEMRTYSFEDYMDILAYLQKDMKPAY